MQHTHGSVVRIRAESFMCWDVLEILPKPGLNVILGPNGNGKSSILCALCLGLGGNPKILMRSDKERDFIKHGHEKASILIELHNSTPGAKNFVIQRVIFQTAKSNVWYIDQKRSDKEAVGKLMKELNVQVENLCQFLPQHAMQDFARMSSQELLENTQKAVSGVELTRLHERLKNTGNSLQLRERDLSRLISERDQATVANRRIETEVRQFREFQRQKDVLQALQRKRIWKECECAREELRMAKTQKEDTEASFRAKKEASDPLLRDAEQANKRAHTAQEKNREMVNVIRNMATEANNKIRGVQEGARKIEDLERQFTEKRQEVLKRESQMKEVRRVIDAMKRQLQQFDGDALKASLDEHTRRHNQCTDQLEILEEELRALTRQSQALQQRDTAMTKELSALEDVNHQKLERMRQRFSQVVSTVLWLRENMHLFRHPVFEPMILTLTVRHPAWSKFVEFLLPERDLTAFLLEDYDDLTTFNEHVRRQKGWRVNALVISKSKQPFRAPKQIDAYRHLGFQHYISELVDAPETVLNYLCHQYKVHQIPVGDERSKELVERIVETCPEMRRFFTASDLYSISKSRYSGRTVSRCKQVPPAKWLTGAANRDAVRDKQDQLQKVRAEMDQLKERVGLKQKQLRDVQRLREESAAQRKALAEKRSSHSKLQSDIDMEERKLSHLESMDVDLDAEKRALAQAIAKVNDGRVAAVAALTDTFQKLDGVCLRKMQAEMGMDLWKKLAHDGEVRAAAFREEMNKLKNELQLKEQLVQQAKQRLDQLLADFRAEVGSHCPGDRLPPSLDKEFRPLPDTLLELEQEICRVQARLDCTQSTSTKVVEEYEGRQKEIARLESSVSQLEDELSNQRGSVAAESAQWLSSIKALIDEVNLRFQRLFRALSCSGEVRLFCPDNADEYDQYGIKILVSYRSSEPLKELDPTRSLQSGGEQSVAIMLFMMALQEIAECPFRCMDETNQGMDPENERRIFQLIADASHRDTQYFWLTPKLLDNLKFGCSMNVMVICRGFGTIASSDWQPQRTLRQRMRRCRVRAREDDADEADEEQAQTSRAAKRGKV